MDSALNNDNLMSELKTQIKTHLFDLKEEFFKYFPDIDEKRKAWKLSETHFSAK